MKRFLESRSREILKAWQCKDSRGLQQDRPCRAVLTLLTLLAPMLIGVTRLSSINLESNYNFCVLTTFTTNVP